MDSYVQLLYDFEVHSVEGITRYFESGGNPNEVHEGVPLFNSLAEMYFRSPKFKECVRIFIRYGLEFKEEALLAVLSEDPGRLRRSLEENPDLVHRQYAVFKNPFTPLTGGTLLHHCAEFNHLECAKVLVAAGADVNAKAAVDEYGFGEHTPIFHTVAQHNNNSLDCFRFLLDQRADPLTTVKGLIWGKGYEWETFIPAVNPISYAMMGVLPQMHRNPTMIAGNISLLLRHAYGIEYQLPNIPNKYLLRS